MSQIVDDLRQVAIEIKTETQVGGNTAARVGGAFERVADALEGTQQIEDMDAAVAAVQQAAQENEQTIQDIVNNLAVVQTMGQSTSAVMSQKAVTDELEPISNLVITKDLTFTTAAGFVGTNGRITNGSSAGYRYTSLIPVQEGQKIEVKCYTSASTLAIAAYSSDNTTTADVASSVQGIGGLRTYTYNVPAGIAYIRVTNQTTNYASPNITRIAPLTHVLDTYDDALDDISVLQHKVLDEKIALSIVNGQFVQSNGNTASNANYQYGEFAVKAGEKYRITNSSTPNALGVAAYKQGATAASVADSVVGAYALKTYDYVVPADIVKLRISHNKGSYPDALAVYNVSRFTEIEEEIAVERGRIDVAEDDIDDIQSLMYDGENKYVSAHSGYVQTDGTILNASSSIYQYSVLIPVTEGDIYEVNTAASLSVLAIAAYSAEDTTTADVSNSVIKNGIFTIRYVVPTGIAYLRITCNVVNLPSPYIKRIAPYNAKFDEIDERLDNLEGGGAKSKPISILFIGNSLTQDAISYLPWLLTTLAPEVSFKFYIWYCGGYTLAEHYSRISNNQTCEIFSRCEDNTAWTNSNNSITMQYILEHYKFDIVCLQEYFNYKSSYTDADLAPFNNIISYIRANYNYPFKVATLFHQPKRDVAESVFNLTKQGNGLILQKTDAEILNPAGIAIYRAMSTDLDNLGDQGHLSPDGTHSQEGLPCILQAYVSALWIFDQLSLPRSVVNEKQRITTAIYNSLYIPGPNGSLIVGTDEQYNLAQDVAVKAWKEGKFMLNANLTEYTN